MESATADQVNAPHPMLAAQTSALEQHIVGIARVATKKTAVHPVATLSAATASVPVPAPVAVQDKSAVVRALSSSPDKETAPPPTPDSAAEQPDATAAPAATTTQDQPMPVAVNQGPAEFRPVRGRGLTSAVVSSGPRPSTTAQIPFFSAPVPVPLPVPAPKFKDTGGPDPQERSTESRTEDAAPVERAAVNDAALEVRIKAPTHESNPKPVTTSADPVPPVAVSTPAPSAPVTLKPVPGPSAAQTALQPAPALAMNPAHAVAAEVTVRTPEAPTHAATQSAPPTARSTDIEEPVPARDTQQPLRSVSLEFSPDGAGDVRLRLSEKSGEIHISLHSSDASLTSRLHEGVHDLVGSLSSAGYEAEAWTRGQGQQNSQREPEQRRNRRADSKETGETFGDVLQQPIQEIS